MKKLLLIQLVILAIFSTNVFAQNPPPLINSGEAIKEGIKFNDEEKYDDALNTFNTVSENDTNYAWALYEKALSSQYKKNYADAVVFAKKGIEEHSEFEYDFYNMLGSVYDKIDSSNQSLYYLNEGIKKYPRYYLLYFNKAISLISLKKDKEALECLEKAISLNVYHPGSHYQLANLYYKYGYTTPALLSFSYFLILEPGSNRSFEAIKKMLKISNNEEYEIADASNFVSYPNGNANFTEIDEIIKSKVAINSRYKSSSAIKDDVVLQLQIMMEKLKYNSADNGMLMQTYVRFFTDVYKQKYYDGFTYLIFSGLDNESLQKTIKKNNSRLTSFTNWAANNINTSRKNSTFEYEGKQYKLDHYYSNSNTLQSVGIESPKTKKQIGKWFYFYNNGNISLDADFNDNGGRQGTWIWYYDNGAIKEKASYVNEKVDGENIEYYKSGLVKTKTIYRAAVIDGEYTSYYTSGQLKEQIPYVNGKKDGIVNTYHANGSRYLKIIFKDDMRMEDYIYDEVDSLSEHLFYNKDGAIEGIYQGFYSNGKKSFEGTYKNNLRTDDWIYYYDNGNLKQKGKYLNGKLVGDWYYFHNNGAFEHKETYNNDGILNGKVIYYDTDSVLHYYLVYEKDKFKSYAFYDKAGKEIHSAKETSGKLYFKRFYPQGMIELEGQLIDSKREGLWTVYEISGSISDKLNYSKGKIEGLRETFHKNGKIKTSINYKNDNYDGYFKAYYANGVMEKEGWYVNGNAQGDWTFYHENGKVDTKIAYLNDDINGHEYIFNENGKKETEYVWKENLTVKSSLFDTSENLYFNVELPNGNGYVDAKWPNGKPYFKARYKNGRRDSIYTFYLGNGKVSFTQNYTFTKRSGAYKSYNEDGTLIEEGNYFNNEKTGPWKNYFASGKIMRTEFFVDGDVQGKRTWYYESGKVETVSEYQNGKKNGWSYYYTEDGTLQYKLKWVEGVPVAYSYLNTSGKEVPEISLNYGNGKVKAFYPNGQPSAEFEYKKGLLSGRFLYYHSNGKIETDETYEDGETNGMYKEFFASGKLKNETEYYFGNKNGISKTYYENGGIEKESTYLLGKKHGVFKYYDQSGKLTKTKHFEYNVFQYAN